LSDEFGGGLVEYAIKKFKELNNIILQLNQEQREKLRDIWDAL